MYAQNCVYVDCTIVECMVGVDESIYALTVYQYGIEGNSSHQQIKVTHTGKSHFISIYRWYALNAFASWLVLLFKYFFSSLSSFSFCTRLPRLPLLLCVITVYAHYVLRFHSFTQRLFLASTNKKRIIIICFSLFFVLGMQYTRVHCSYLSKRGSIQSNQIELIIVRFVAESWYKFNIKLCVHST